MNEHESHHHHSHEEPMVAPQSEIVEPVAAVSGSPAWLLPASILAAAVLISGSLIYMTHSKGAVAAPNQKQDDSASVTVEAPTAEDRDVILGQADAPISIVQYEDFQCPFCAQYFSETESQIRTAYVQTGKAKIVYRHLAFLGPESIAAAEASECAKDQSKFWEYHDALFTAEVADGKEHNGNLNRALFMKIAGDLKLDTTAFGSCIDSKKYADFVAKQTKEAGSKYGVQSTPTIFVNDQKVEGAYPFAAFQQIIDGILKK